MSWQNHHTTRLGLLYTGIWSYILPTNPSEFTELQNDAAVCFSTLGMHWFILQTSVSADIRLVDSISLSTWHPAVAVVFTLRHIKYCAVLNTNSVPSPRGKWKRVWDEQRSSRGRLWDAVNSLSSHQVTPWFFLHCEQADGGCIQLQYDATLFSKMSTGKL